MTITVTAEDIRDGKKGAANSCAIALAARRAGLRQPSVDSDTMEYMVPGDDGWLEPVMVSLPRDAQAFVDRFDGGIEVEPFAFEIEVPR